MIQDYSYEDFEKRLTIDLSILQQELIEQAPMYNQIGKNAIQVRMEMDSLKIDLELKKVSLTLEFKKLKPKPTEAEIKSKISLDQNVLNLEEDILEAKELYDMWSNMRTAYEQRKSLLVRIAELSDLTIVLNDSTIEPIQPKSSKRVRAKAKITKEA